MKVKNLENRADLLLMLVSIFLCTSCSPEKPKNLDRDSSSNQTVVSEHIPLENSPVLVSVEELSALDYVSSHEKWGGANECYYWDDPEVQTARCMFGPEVERLSYEERCGFGSYGGLSRYHMHFEEGELQRVEIWGVELDFNIEVIQELGLKPSWPNQFTVQRGGPGHAYIWTRIPGILRLEVHSTKELDKVRQIVIWFHHEQGMGSYIHWSDRYQPPDYIDCNESFEDHPKWGGFCLE